MGSCIWTNKENPPAIQLLSSLQIVTFTIFSEPCLSLLKARNLKIRGIDYPGCKKKVLFYPVMSYLFGSL